MAVVAMAIGYDIYFEEQFWAHFEDVAAPLLAIFVALLSMIISFRIFVEQRLARQAGTDPVVIAHLTKRADAPSMIMLSISNVGAGAALNVKVVPLIQHGDEIGNRIITNPLLVQHPIGVIPQNESIEYHFGAGHTLLGDDPVPSFEVLVTFDDIEGGKHSQKMTIDVRELEHQGVFKPPISRVADSIEKLEKTGKAGFLGNEEINVVVQTIDQRRKEEAERHEEMRAFIQKQKDRT